ncbi:ABC transporter ATP-binding protein [Marinoscillum sp. MHG1-6]|uniref:ABC transporter ATP-binding protein n=1 Tax=Marinoscillum sp. MHG1-6 TaxID=2959627 RepID=UPI002157059C|nr:ABC transporter ATP-binding protein [Marinoscillum sp. MHG1-6]
MQIQLENIGKKFGKEWIFRGVDLTIVSGERLAITGSNGAGKSTLLRIMGSYMTPTEGKILLDQKDLKHEDDSQLSFNFAAPYYHLIEEYTLSELLSFHEKFKKPTSNIDELVETSGLYKARSKFVKDFSSGMKQRVKLILALGFDADVVLLDEPTTNLDRSGINWFKNLFDTQYEKRTLVIASNLAEEIAMCDDEFHIN